MTTLSSRRIAPLRRTGDALFDYTYNVDFLQDDQRDTRYWYSRKDAEYELYSTPAVLQHELENGNYFPILNKQTNKIMELTKEHRIALLHRLPNAIAERDRAQRLAGSDNAKDCKELLEIDAFLRGLEVAAIENALIENEIDY